MSRKIYFIIATTLSLLMLGCNTDDPSNKVRQIVLDSTTIEASDDSNSYNIAYNIVDPLPGVELLAQCDTEWIRDISTADNTLSFRLLGNPSDESREGVITLKYPSLDDVIVTIRQQGTVGTKLDIKFTSTDYSSCSVDITPNDKEMLYIVMMAERQYFSAMGISDAESLVSSDINYFLSYMGDADVSFERFIIDSKISMQGDNTKSWTGLSPAKEYIIYAYGIELSEDTYTRTTPVYHLSLGKRLPERSAMDFDIEITADGPEVNFDISPRDWDGYYMVQLVADNENGYVAQGTPLDENFEEAVSEAFFYISDYLYYYYEHSIEEIFEMVGYKGHINYHKTLNANHKYMAIVYAIDSIDGNIPMMVSKPVVKYFATGDVMMSDITFNVEIDNVKPRSADITITPSSNDESYTAVIMYAESLPDGTPQEQLQYVLNKYSIFEMKGRYSECVEGLTPDTEFVLAIFGVYAGAPTTDLVVHRFRTPAQSSGSNRITSIKYAAYDLDEVVSLDDYYGSMLGYGDYFLSVDINTLEPTERVYFDIFSVASYEENGIEWIRESLFDYSYHSLFDWALCIYGNQYVVCGLAEDSTGNVGEMFISDYITVTESDIQDAAEFVDRYKEYTE